MDEDGGPVMDAGSSTYAFTFDGKDALAALVKAEYLPAGLSRPYLPNPG